jgi:uncharacterized membrane protein YadS
MSIPYREQRRLRHTACALRAADPHLAGMFAVFARITSAEALPASERIPRPLARCLPHLLIAVAVAAVGCAVWLAARARRGLRYLAGRCARALRAALRLARGRPGAPRAEAPSAKHCMEQ